MTDSTGSKVPCAACNPDLKHAKPGKTIPPIEVCLSATENAGADAFEARKIGRTSDDINSKVHAPADACGRLLRFHPTTRR